MQAPCISFVVTVTAPGLAASPLANAQNNAPLCPATHCNAFRGFFWHGASAELATAPRSDTAVFHITLKWAHRPPAFLEQHAPTHHAFSRTNPEIVTLEFMHCTPTRSEFRGSCSFNVLDIFTTATTYTADINAFLLGDANIDKSGIPPRLQVEIHNASASANCILPRRSHPHPLAPYLLHMDKQYSVLDNAATDWISEVLKCFATHKTLFLNLRTYVRKPFLPLLFTDLPFMWARIGSALPPEIPLYCLANAVIVNGFSRHDLEDSLPNFLRVDTPLLLRLIRDTIMVSSSSSSPCLTPPSLSPATDPTPPLSVQGNSMCLKEGAYFMDSFFGLPSDDQAFVSGMHHDPTVFSYDDCEGVCVCVCACFFSSHACRA